MRLRATYEQEGNDIIINSLPYQISGNKILEQIAAQMRSKKLPLVEDLRDESDQILCTRMSVPFKNGSDSDTQFHKEIQTRHEREKVEKRLPTVFMNVF